MSRAAGNLIHNMKKEGRLAVQYTLAELFMYPVCADSGFEQEAERGETSMKYLVNVSEKKGASAACNKTIYLRYAPTFREETLQVETCEEETIKHLLTHLCDSVCSGRRLLIRTFSPYFASSFSSVPLSSSSKNKHLCCR